MLSDSNVSFVIGRAVFCGLLACVGTLIALRQSSRFRRVGYWWWLGGAIGIALLMPYTYMSITSYNITYVDALLLRGLHAGSWRVAEGYAVLAGVVIAGLCCLVLVGRRSR